MSSELKKCKSFLGLPSGVKRTLFWINSTSARSIAVFSAFPDEKESILLPGTQVKIIDKTIDPKDKTLIIVTLEEINMVRESKNITFENY